MNHCDFSDLSHVGSCVSVEPAVIIRMLFNPLMAKWEAVSVKAHVFNGAPLPDAKIIVNTRYKYGGNSTADQGRNLKQITPEIQIIFVELFSRNRNVKTAQKCRATVI